jgi:hypothetical protein
MKKRRLILIALTLFVTTFGVKAQVNLPLNSSGKAEVAEVVAVDSLNRYELYSHAENLLPGISAFVEKMDVIENDPIAGKISCALRFTAYNQQLGILKKEIGAVTYKMSIEVKDGKYRYSFSDIIFHYYKQDRNYKMVETGQKKGLEEAKASGWQKNWNGCRAITSTKITNQVKLITEKMKEKKKAVTPATAEVKKLDW